MASSNTSINSLSDRPLGELIKRIRSINELTQESLGQLFKPSVTQPTIARWEKGEQMPDRIHFSKIAYFLDLTQEELQKLIDNSPIDVENLHIEKKIFTPNKKHLNILKRGVTSWNKWREKHPDIIPVLAGIELSHFDLDRINLDGADLRGIKLSNINSRSSSYQMVDLRYAYLNQVYFFNSNFSQADISRAEVRFTYFNDSRLFKANLYKSKLSKVYLNSANLSEANLSEANITNSDLSGANCIETSFENASIYDSNVFGASFLEAKVNGVKLEDVYLSASDTNRNLSINDLLSAQSIYLQRYNRAKFKSILNNFELEEEIIDLASTLANKFGNYCHSEDFNIFNNYFANNQSPPFVEARRTADYFYVEFNPDFRDIKLVLSGKANCRKILIINDGIIESNFKLEDVDKLRELVHSTEKLQEERVNHFIPIVQKILEINKSNNFTCKKYIIEQINEEIVLYGNTEYKIEIMRVSFNEKQLKIIRSSLSEECLMHFQQLLLNLLM